MKTLYSITLVFAFSAGAMAQANFVKGYYLDNKGDTVRGEIKINPKKDWDVFNKFYFRDANGVQRTFKPTKVKAYGFDNRNFVAMDSDGEKKFFEVMVSGDISLYRLTFETLRMNQSVYESEYYLKRPDDKKYEVVKENRFKKQMTEWMEDNPELVESYEEEKKFDPEKAVELINRYNDWKKGSAAK